MSVTPEVPVGELPRCSAKGCRADATVDLRWRNPRLHDAAREKHWLACTDHDDSLAAFLERRGFLLGRGPWPAGNEAAGNEAVGNDGFVEPG